MYLGCNLNHYFTPPAERAQKHIEDGEVGELIYCLHKMGFAGGEETYQPQSSPRMKGVSVLPHESVSDASVQRHALLLWRHHACSRVCQPTKLSEKGG